MELTSLAEAIGIALVVGGFYWKLINKRLDKVEERLRDISKELTEIRINMSGMQAEAILLQTMPDENKRSEAAKKMWERRRAQKALRNSKDKELG